MGRERGERGGIDRESKVRSEGEQNKDKNKNKNNNNNTNNNADVNFIPFLWNFHPKCVFYFFSTATVQEKNSRLIYVMNKTLFLQKEHGRTVLMILDYNRRV